MKPSGAAVLLLIAALLATPGCGRNGGAEEIVVLQVPKDEPQGPQPSPAPKMEASQGVTATDAPPSFWKKLPPSPLRLLSYQITDTASGKGADVSLVILGGVAGGALENVNRWRGQIGLGALDEEGLRNGSSTANTSLGTITLVDMTGRPEKGDASKDGRIIAAILPLGERTLFFKMRGNPDLTGCRKREFLDWISTVRLVP